MTSTTLSKTDRIRELNDAFRRSFVGGAVMITAGVEAMPGDQRRSLLQKVRGFEAFSEDNDPHGEHDFGSVDEGETRCFWKIDYYDRATETGSPDPADPAVTTRVLTIMLADELSAQRSPGERTTPGMRTPRSRLPRFSAASPLPLPRIFNLRRLSPCLASKPSRHPAHAETHAAPCLAFGPRQGDDSIVGQSRPTGLRDRRP